MIPAPDAVPGRVERFTAHRMERILAVVAGLGSAVLGTQAFIDALTDPSGLDGPHAVMMVLVFVPLLAMVVGCLSGRWAKQTLGVFAVAYVVAVLLWPFVIEHPSPAEPGDQPWVFFLVNIGVVAAMIAFPTPVQFVWWLVSLSSTATCAS